MPRVVISESVSFETDDKRAQYARLVVYNHGIKCGYYKKDITPTSVSAANLKRAWEDLVKGNYLEGSDGIKYIQSMTKYGAEHPEVSRRGLTKSYAQEVRPFIRKGLLSPTFGRRRKEPVKVEVQDTPKKKTPVKKAPVKKATPRAQSMKMAEARIKHEKSVI